MSEERVLQVALTLLALCKSISLPSLQSQDQKKTLGTGCTSQTDPFMSFLEQKPH